MVDSLVLEQTLDAVFDEPVDVFVALVMLEQIPLAVVADPAEEAAISRLEETIIHSMDHL